MPSGVPDRTTHSRSNPERCGGAHRDGETDGRRRMQRGLLRLFESPGKEQRSRALHPQLVEPRLGGPTQLTSELGVLREDALGAREQGAVDLGSVTRLLPLVMVDPDGRPIAVDAAVTDG